MEEEHEQGFNASLNVVKGLTKLFTFIVTPLVIFLVTIVIVISTITLGYSSNNGNQLDYEGTYCTVNTVNEDSIENVEDLEYFKDNLLNSNWSVIALAIYEYDNSSKDSIVESLNTLNDYLEINDYEVHESSIIQYMKYGTDFIDYVLKNDKYEVTVSFNEQYEQEKGLDLEQQEYYFKVTKEFNVDCFYNVGGLPVSEDLNYRISGWYPNYNKNGSGAKHGGIDLAVGMETPIYAVEEGTVLRVHNGERSNNLLEKVGLYGAGNVVVVQSKTRVYLYAHLSSGLVKEGQEVQLGQLVGLSGSSGFSTGPHLHLEIVDNTPNWESSWGNLNRTLNPCIIIENLCEGK